jgi:hypothetical protein
MVIISSSAKQNELGESLLQFYFVRHKFYMKFPGLKPPLSREVSTSDPLRYGRPAYQHVLGLEIFPCAHYYNRTSIDRIILGWVQQAVKSFRLQYA